MSTITAQERKYAIAQVADGPPTIRQQAIQISYLLLRVAAGFMFLQVGSTKVFGWFGGMPPGAAMTTELWIAGTLEVAGGILMILGLFTTPIAFILSGEMAVAYFQAHQPKAMWPLQNGGQPAVLFCFIWLYIAAQGGGVWSIDALLAARTPRPPEP